MEKWVPSSWQLVDLRLAPDQQAKRYAGRGQLVLSNMGWGPKKMQATSRLLGVGMFLGRCGQCGGV